MIPIPLKKYEIEKPVLVCDSCNTLLVDEQGKVYKACNWNEWGLACDEHDMSGFEVFERYKEGDRIPKNHYLFTPMKIIFYDKDGEIF